MLYYVDKSPLYHAVGSQWTARQVWPWPFHFGEQKCAFGCTSEIIVFDTTFEIKAVVVGSPRCTIRDMQCSEEAHGGL